MHQGIYEELKRIARAKSLTDYTTIGRVIGLDMRNAADRNKIAKILDEINLNEEKRRRPMLSAVVIRQDIKMPGEGFFECARQLKRYRGKDNFLFWVREVAKVYKYWQSH